MQSASRSPSRVRFSFDEQRNGHEPAVDRREAYKPAFTPHPRASDVDPFDEACASEISGRSSSGEVPNKWLPDSADPQTPGSVYDSPNGLEDADAPDSDTRSRSLPTSQRQQQPLKLHLPNKQRTFSTSVPKSARDVATAPAMPSPARTVNHIGSTNRTMASYMASPNTPTLPPSYVRSPDRPNFASVPAQTYITSPRQSAFQSPFLAQSPVVSANPFATPFSPPKHNSDDTLVNEGWRLGNSVNGAEHEAINIEPDPAHWPIENNPSPHKQQLPLKPALRRTSTEEQVRRQPARDAVDLAERIRHGDDDELLSGGVLSQLLRLHAMQSGNGKSLTEGNLASLEDGNVGKSEDGMSRVSSYDSGLPPSNGLRRRRAGSDCSVATTVNVHELDPHDPRLDPNYKSNRFLSRRKKGWGRRRSASWAERKVVDKMDGKDKEDEEDDEKAASRRKKERLKITANVATILQKQQFILKLAKTLMTFGSPSHRLEAQLSATAHALNIDAQFMHLPSILVACFGDHDTRTSETVFIKASGDLNLGNVHKTHEIYRLVLAGELEVAEGTAALVSLLKAKPIYSAWVRIILAATCAGIIGPLAFGGSLLDGVASFVLGTAMAWLQTRVVAKSASYANIFEISCTCIIAFIARALSQTQVFCYQSLVSAGVVGLLPGYIILCGSLDLASRHIISGAVKMVFAIIYALFLGFGVAVGSDVYLLIDQGAQQVAISNAEAAGISVSGTFQSNTTDSAIANWTGTFTFSNSTASAQADLLAAASMFCNRAPDLPWWRTTLPWWAQFILVPIFATLLSLSNMSPIRSREFPVMIIIGCIGWATNTAANKFIFDRSDVVSFIGSMVIGLLGNIYSRVLKGTAFTAMATGVLFLVPAGFSAAGGIGTTSMTADGDSYTNGLTIGFRMIQVSIGITVGLFFSSFIVYSFGHSHKGNAIFAF